MQIVIEIDEARYKDIQRIAEVQLESNHFQTAEQIIANGVSIEQEPILDKIRAEINSPNRGTCDYFIVDRIEEIIDKYKAESEDV